MSGTVRGGGELCWGDVERAMRAVEGHHLVVLTLVVSPRAGYTTGMLVSLVAVESPTMGHPVNPGGPRVWTVKSPYVETDTRELAPLSYRLTLEIDALLGQERWAQVPLPGVSLP